MDLRELKLSKNNLRHPWETARINFASSVIRSNKKKAQLRILDVGSGDSLVLHTLLGIYPEAEAVGVDINYTPEIIRELGELFSPNPRLTLVSHLDELDQSKAVFDIVLMMDVIEHIEDEVAVLKEVKAHPLIGADTLFIITVPAYQALFSNHDTFLGHYRRYNSKLLRERVESGGLEISRIGYFFLLALMARWAKLRFFPDKSTEAPESELLNWKYGPGFTSFVVVVLKVDIAFGFMFNKLGINIPGLSNYALCKPKFV